MRLATLSLLSLLLLLGAGHYGLAQNAAPDRSGAMSSSATPQAADPSGPDKTMGRVGTLSPDEQRRAIRARERAHAGAKATPAAPASVAVKAAPDGAAAKTVTNNATPKVDPDRAIKIGPGVATPSRAADRVKPVSTDRRRTAAVSPYRAGHERMRPAATSRFYAWGRPPRVGDVIPPGVPLSPLPPGYRPPPPYARTAMELPPRPWRYGPYPMVRVGPPFPDGRYDE